MYRAVSKPEFPNTRVLKSRNQGIIKRKVPSFGNQKLEGLASKAFFKTIDIDHPRKMELIRMTKSFQLFPIRKYQMELINGYKREVEV
jgi:hypothetical protein